MLTRPISSLWILCAMFSVLTFGGCGTEEESNPDSDAATSSDTAAADTTDENDTSVANDTNVAVDTFLDSTTADLLADSPALDVLDVQEDLGLDTSEVSDDVDTADAVWPTATWETFTITKGRGPCPPDAPPCTWSWVLTPDGAIVGDTRGTPFTDQMSFDDFTVINDILDDPAFMTLMEQGFTCGQPPTDVGISFEFAPTPSTLLTQNITGCALAEDLSGGYAETIHATLTPYVGP